MTKYLLITVLIGLVSNPARANEPDLFTSIEKFQKKTFTMIKKAQCQGADLDDRSKAKIEKAYQELETLMKFFAQRDGYERYTQTAHKLTKYSIEREVRIRREFCSNFGEVIQSFERISEVGKTLFSYTPIGIIHSATRHWWEKEYGKAKKQFREIAQSDER